MNPHDEKNLERLVDRALRDLPPRRAPQTLEIRVQAEIARRAARPWWLKGFTHWPMAARGAFAVVCIGLVPLVIMAITWGTARVNAAQLKVVFASELHWANAAAHFGGTIMTLAADLIGSIPPLWLYGGAATIAALYVALFGLGAAAYRTLYATS